MYVYDISFLIVNINSLQLHETVLTVVRFFGSEVGGLGQGKKWHGGGLRCD